MQSNGQEQHPHTAEYKGKKPWRFTVDSDFIRKATGLNGEPLSASARALYLIIQSYVGPTSPVPFPKIGTIAHYMGVGADTLRRYMKELTDGGWLRVEQRRRGWNQFDSNAFILLDGDEAVEEPCMENTRTDNPGAARLNAVDPCAADTRTKSTQSDQQPRAKSTQNRVAKRNTSSNSGPSGTHAAAAADPTPSAAFSGADAPEPPTPASKAETFIKSYQHWTEAAGFSGTVVPRERQALIGFFTDNPGFAPRELTAIMLSAWQMLEGPVSKDSDHEPWWHCNLKSKRIKTLLDFLPNIQDEMEWNSSEKKIEKVYRLAEQKFLQAKAA